MISMMLYRIIYTLTHALLTIVIILFIFTGVGITNYQLIESLTAGTVTKLTSFQIHTNLTIPLILLLAAHIALTIGKKIRRSNLP
jgi:hypothetical protein